MVLDRIQVGVVIELFFVDSTLAEDLRDGKHWCLSYSFQSCILLPVLKNPTYSRDPILTCTAFAFV